MNFQDDARWSSLNYWSSSISQRNLSTLKPAPWFDPFSRDVDFIKCASCSFRACIRYQRRCWIDTRGCADIRLNWCFFSNTAHWSPRNLLHIFSEYWAKKAAINASHGSFCCMGRCVEGVILLKSLFSKENYLLKSGDYLTSSGFSSST